MPWKKKIDEKKILDKSISDYLKKISSTLLRGFVLRTPVDTGTLRGGWVVGVNSPNTSDGSPSTSPTPPIQLGMGMMRTATKAEHKIYISNNINYIMAIENGHGLNNTPGGIIQATLRTLRR